MKIFDSIADDLFKKELVEKFRTKFDNVISPQSREQAYEFIERYFHCATTSGITETEDIERFIEFAIQEGENFITDPEITEILKNDRFDGEDKVDEIQIYLQETKESGQ